MKRIILLLSSLTLAASAVVFASPATVPWDITTTTIWADTLPGRFSGDSAAYSVPIDVFGARGIIVDAQTTGGAYPTDTLSVGEPIFDVRGDGVYTTYPGGGIGKVMPGIEVAAGGVINPEGTQIYKWYAATPPGAGGTPIPTVTRYIKFKVKSGNTRLKTSGTGVAPVVLQAVGTITLRVHVIR